MSKAPPYLTSILDHHSESNPNKLACFFLDAQIREKLDYQTLVQRSKSIATYLQKYNPIKERVLILLPQSLDYIAAFLGCLYAGAIAVTAYPITRPNIMERVKLITQKTLPKFIISNSYTPFIQELVSFSQGHIFYIDIKNIALESHQFYYPIKIQSDDIAFLQFSSGSTGDPKGVIITHQNINSNLLMMKHAFKQDCNSTFISWAPLFHDMGLICAALSSIYLNSTLGLMAPISFIKNPISWLKAISDYRGTISYAPDFAYKMCANEITDIQKKELDLSCWQSAVIGAEPVRGSTLELFYDKFKDTGFRKNALCPAYGLAEATVFVSGCINKNGPIYCEQDEKSYVACGTPQLDQKIYIVNIDTLQPCNAGEIGEIWISGTNVSCGYWKSKKLSLENFYAYTRNGSGPFLRSGDLGFLDAENRLYITGRIKDLIIIHGKNYAAHDIEETVIKSQPFLTDSLVVAFSIEEEDIEKLIILVGIKRNTKISKHEDLIKNIKQEIYNSHNITPFKILFINRNQVPKTTSGKLQRQFAKTLFINRKISVLELDNVMA